MISFVPERYFRPEQNYFLDFFPQRAYFTEFMWDNVLTDEQSQEITDAFLAVVYYSFERAYRNKIVLEQEYFYQDFAREMFDKRLRLQLLFKLWMLKNDDDPFDMINENYNEWYKHDRTDDGSEHNKETTDENKKLKEQEQAKADVDSDAQSQGKTQALDTSQEQEQAKADSEAKSKTDDTLTRHSEINETDKIVGNVESKANSSATTDTKTTELTDTTNLRRANDGSLQTTLALSDMIDGDEVQDTPEVATSASAERNKSNTQGTLDSTSTNESTTNSETTNDRNRNSTTDANDKRNSEVESASQTKNERASTTQRENTSLVDNKTNTRSQAQNERLNNAEQINNRNQERDKSTHNKTHTFDERKRNKLNKVALINSFSDLDLQIGIQKFARSFQTLFSRMSGSDFIWRGYVRTDFDELNLDPIPKHETPLSNLITEDNIGFIPDNKVNSAKITEQVIFTNPQATPNDFFVANINVPKGRAYLIGDGDYNGSVEVDFHISPQKERINYRKEQNG